MNKYSLPYSPLVLHVLCLCAHLGRKGVRRRISDRMDTLHLGWTTFYSQLPMLETTLLQVSIIYPCWCIQATRLISAPIHQGKAPTLMTIETPHRPSVILACILTYYGLLVASASLSLACWWASVPCIGKNVRGKVISMNHLCFKCMLD